MKSTLQSLIFAGAFALAASSFAQTIPVASYSYGTPPDSGYPDSGGTELTDGIDLTLAWGYGISIGYEDVVPLAGWQGYDPNVTFFFDGFVTVGSFTAWFADSNGHAGVYLPTSITLSAPGGFSETFLVTDPAGDGSTVPLSFGGFEVFTDRITLTAVNPHNWVMMSEVSFAGATIPEPAAAAGLLGVFAGVWTLARRRTRVA